MSKKSKTLLYFGNEKLASGIDESGIIIKSLLANDYTIAHVFINQSSRQSRSKKINQVESIAAEHDIPMTTHWDEQLVLDVIEQTGVTHAVLAAYGKIIPKTVLDKIEIINIHPSLLPKLRGSSPIEQAILTNTSRDGETFETGVSIMKLVEKMDAGPIYGKATLHLPERITKQDLYDQLSILGSELLVQLLPSIINGSAEAELQDETAATFSRIIQKQDGKINWDQPAATLLKAIDAYASWPGSFCIEPFHDRVVIVDAEYSDQTGPTGQMRDNNGQLIIFCSDGALQINQLTPAGKKQMTGQSYLAGHPIK